MKAITYKSKARVLLQSLNKLVMIILMAVSLASSVNAENISNRMSMSCHLDVQSSLGEDGTTTLIPEMFLSGNYPDYGIFTVDIEGDLEDILSCDEIEMSLTVTVLDTTTQNSCWSNVHVENKMDPFLVCDIAEVFCGIDYTELGSDYYIDIIDNCSDFDDMGIWYNETITDINCEPDITAVVERTWFVVDQSGNQSSCNQTINIVKPELSDVTFPGDTSVFCPIPNTDPDSFGVPTIDGMPIDPFCEIVSWHTDSVFEICSGNYIITRTWNAMDWCDISTVITDDQIITVFNDTPPVVECPADTSIAVGINACDVLFYTRGIECY